MGLMAHLTITLHLLIIILLHITLAVVTWVAAVTTVVAVIAKQILSPCSARYKGFFVLFKPSYYHFLHK